MATIIRVGELEFNQQDTIGHGSSGTFVFSGSFWGSKSSESKPTLVAIKRIVKNPLLDQSTDIHQEVELMKTVGNHPNILRIIHTEFKYELLYIATELCRGTLEQYVHGNYKGPEFEDEKEILHQVTRGLSHLHKEKIVHRDIKPTNIFIFVPDDGIEAKPIMKLADFGISKMLKENNEDFTNTSQTNPNGTRGWMPPEIYDSNRVDFSVDVWALGCIFAFTLSGGKHPFGDDPEARQNLIKNKKSMILTQENFKEPYSKDTFAFELIKFMLEADPSKRPTVRDVENSFFISQAPRFSKMCELFKDATYSVPTISISLFEKLVRDEAVEVYVKIENENTPFHIFGGWYRKDDLIDFFRFEIENIGGDVNTNTEDGETSLHLLMLNYKNGNLEDIIHLLTRKGHIEEIEREDVVSSPVLSNAADETDQSSIPNINELVDESEDESVVVPAFGASSSGRPNTTLPGTENGRVEQQDNIENDNNRMQGFIRKVISYIGNRKLKLIIIFSLFISSIVFIDSFNLNTKNNELNEALILLFFPD